MNCNTLQELSEFHAFEVRNHLSEIVCSEMLKGNKNVCNCTKAHTLRELGFIPCYAYKYCCADGCPFSHHYTRTPKRSWADDDYDEPIDEDILFFSFFTSTKGYNKDYYIPYHNSSLLAEARDRRTHHYSYPTLHELLESYSIFPKNSFIPEDLKPVDTSNEFELYTQTSVTRHSSEIDRSLRGVVVERETKTILVRTFPFVPELTPNDPDFITLVNMELRDSMVVKTYEGTQFRLWYYEKNKKWYISTNGKLDSFTSKKHNKTTLGQQFAEMVTHQTKFDFEVFCTTLRSDLIYTFWLVADPSTREICNHKAQYLYFLGCFDPLRRFAYTQPNIGGIPYPPSINDHKQCVYKTYTATDLLEMLNDPTDTELTSLQIQGYTLISRRGTMFKVCTQKYKDHKHSHKSSNANPFSPFFMCYNNTSEFDMFSSSFQPHTDNHQKLMKLHTAYKAFIEELYNQYIDRSNCLRKKKQPVKVEPMNNFIICNTREFVKNKHITTKDIEDCIRLLCKKDKTLSLGLLRLLCSECLEIPTLDPVEVRQRDALPVSGTISAANLFGYRRDIRREYKRLIVPSSPACDRSISSSPMSFLGKEPICMTPSPTSFLPSESPFSSPCPSPSLSPSESSPSIMEGRRRHYHKSSRPSTPDFRPSRFTNRKPEKI